MKRSKAISIIARLLIRQDIKSQFVDKNCVFEFYDAYELNAEDILSSLEEAGMRPPKDPVTLLSKWEPEDESE